MERLYITPLALSWLKKGLVYIINEYLKNEYSLIPVDNEKNPIYIGKNTSIGEQIKKMFLIVMINLVM